MPAILWPDVTAEVVTYLRDSLTGRAEAYTTGVQVLDRVPSTRPLRLVVVRDDGGPGLTDVRAVARIGVRVWAGTHEDATDLANLTCALVAAIPDGQPFVRADVSRPYPIADESGQPYRYFTAELIVRGVSLTP